MFPKFCLRHDSYVRHEHKHKGVNCPRPKILEYRIIRATNPERFGQKELHNLARLIKITIIPFSLFPDQA